MKESKFIEELNNIDNLTKQLKAKKKHSKQIVVVFYTKCFFYSICDFLI